MKTNFLTFALVLNSFLCIALNYPNGKNPQPKWETNLSGNKMFIENNGQFDGLVGLNGKPMYAINNANEQIVFTNKGISYVYLVKKQAKKTPFWKHKDIKESEEEKNSQLITSIISMNWEGANNNVEIIAEDKQNHFYYYRDYNSNNPFKCNGFKKITYKNLYEGIDVEYTIHKKTGYKYNVIVHAGADFSKVKMAYSKNAKVISDKQNGMLVISNNGTILEHAPVSFTKKQDKVVSHFNIQKNNIVTFTIGAYDKTQDLIIDPWTISPGFTTINKGYDVERNMTTGDVFVFGGFPPYELKKFDATGTLLWTYVTSPFTPTPGGTFYGDLAIDPTGDLYLSNGCCTSQIIKLNGNTMAIIWTMSSMSEPWRLAYDPVNNVLISGGGLSYSYITKINPSTGAVISDFELNTLSEPRAIETTPTGNILTLYVPFGQIGTSSDNRITLSNPSLAVQYDIQDNYTLYEFGAFYADNDSDPNISGNCSTGYCFHGFNGFGVGTNYYYTYDGSTIYKRDYLTGASSASVIVPNGSADYVSGITVDDCGNVYAGTQNSIVKYDPNLNLINTTPTTGSVYDIIVGATGEIIACGNGFVTSLPLSSCFSTYITTTPISCTGLCDATAFASQPTTGLAPFTYTWSTGATTQTVTGLCVGVYSVMVADATGSITVAQATVTAPPTLSIVVTSTMAPCGSTLGIAHAQVSGGTGAYIYTWTPTNQTNSTATNLSAGVYSVLVKDANLCAKIATVQINMGPPPFVFLSSNTISCFGDCNGSIISTVTLGSLPYSYLWSNAAVSSNLTNICVGSYSCIVTDKYGCKDTANIAVLQNSELILNTNFTRCKQDLANGSATVSAQGGTPNYNITWNTIPTQTELSAYNLSTGSYTVLVRDFFNCTKQSIVTIPECPKDSIHIPNVFTPNGDGINDVFKIYNVGYNSLHCEIYNRWGKKLYEWDDVNGSWNGKINNTTGVDGVYFYIYKAIKFDDTVNENKGFFHLYGN